MEYCRNKDYTDYCKKFEKYCEEICSMYSPTLSIKKPIITSFPQKLVLKNKYHNNTITEGKEYEIKSLYTHDGIEPHYKYIIENDNGELWAIDTRQFHEEYTERYDKYFYLNLIDGKIKILSKKDNKDIFDDYRWNTMNYFKTEEDAQKVLSNLFIYF